MTLPDRVRLYHVFSMRSARAIQYGGEEEEASSRKMFGAASLSSSLSGNPASEAGTGREREKPRTGGGEERERERKGFTRAQQLLPGPLDVVPTSPI